ncbi:MAG TPA: hypothetical protein VMY77_11830 [Chitinophagaceae bacterium]|nr:hypothetical protein [Chitinophagaceae bacterium]
MADEKTQAERIAVLLQEIKPNVTKGDRDFAAQELKITEVTVSRYLSGTGVDADTAASLLMIFRDRIAEREKVIEA